ncbi:MAG: ABC transporter substrate-binding protein [Deltaproteobacteria bacterium]|jgi:polar amino acid transport system substrate-binding protein|nr:ABC transporter substrate-binding protein [Deltaproteobacteria bacterium]
MLKKFLFLTLLTLALSFSASALLAQTEIINGIDGDYAPFAFIDDKGQAQGFDIDCVNWIAEKKGLKVTHQAQDWSAIVNLLSSKKIDMIASGLSVTEERAKQINFTKPYFTIKQAILVTKDSTLTLDEVLKTGKTIGVQSGTSDEAAMKENNGKDGNNYVLQSFPGATEAAEDLVNGRIQAALVNDQRATPLIESFNLKFLGYANVPSEDYAYGVNKENAELLATLNEGLDQLMADPIWTELKKKYNLDINFQ